MNSIYAEYFMVYLLRVRASGWSLRIVLAAWWGRSLLRGEAVCPSPSVLTPYSPGHASTTMWRGWEGGWRGGRGRWGRQLATPTLSFSIFPAWCSFIAIPGDNPPAPPRPPTKCCNLTSLTKGNIYEQDWLACRVAECHFSLHPQQLLADT